jgi:hypothetical protein
MIYLFYTNIKDCQDRINKCDIDLAIDRSGANTETYAIPEKHPEKEIYALCIEQNYVHLFTDLELETAHEKDESWINKMEMI